MKSLMSALMTVFAIAQPSSSLYGDFSFNIVDLHNRNAGVHSNAPAINNAGEIIVNYYNPDDWPRNRRAGAAVIDICRKSETRLGGWHFGAFDINDNGFVVGFAPRGDRDWPGAYCWNLKTGVSQFLYSAMDSPVSYAYSVNNNGEVVGELCRDYCNKSYLFWKNINDNPIEIPDDYKIVKGELNNSGKVPVYTSTLFSQEVYIWEEGKDIVSIGTLFPDRQTFVHTTGINDLDTVVGTVNYAIDTQNGIEVVGNGYIWTPDEGMKHFVAFIPTVINNNNFIAGSRYDLRRKEYTGLYISIEDVIYELPTLGVDGTHLINDINDHGIMVGVSTTPAGFRHACAWIPVQRSELQRGDFNKDSAINISDAVSILNYLFSDGGCSMCPEVGNVNGDEFLDISDPIYLLLYLFAGGDSIKGGTVSCSISI